MNDIMHFQFLNMTIISLNQIPFNPQEWHTIAISNRFEEQTRRTQFPKCRDQATIRSWWKEWMDTEKKTLQSDTTPPTDLARKNEIWGFKEYCRMTSINRTKEIRKAHQVTIQTTSKQSRRELHKTLGNHEKRSKHLNPQHWRIEKDKHLEASQEERKEGKKKRKKRGSWSW